MHTGEDSRLRLTLVVATLVCGWGAAAVADEGADPWSSLQQKLDAVAPRLRAPTAARRTFFEARITLDATGRIAVLDLVDPALAPLTAEWTRELRRVEPWPRLPREASTLTVAVDVVEVRPVPDTVSVSALDDASAPDLPAATAVLQRSMDGASSCPTAARTRPRTETLAVAGLTVRVAPSGSVTEVAGVPGASPFGPCLAASLRAAHLPRADRARSFGLDVSVESGPPRVRLSLADPGQRLPAIAHALQDEEDRLRECFTAQARSDPSLAGRTTFEVLVDAAGAVAVASVVESTVRSDAVNECAISSIQRLRLPPALSPAAPLVGLRHQVLFRLEELAGDAASSDVGWTTARSDHFLLFTEGGRGVARRSLEEAERAYQAVRVALGVHFPSVPDLKGVQTLVVVFSGDLYTQVAPPRSGGVFRPGSTWGDEDLVIVWRLGGFETLRHELVHRFLHDLVPGVPPWLNEGLAQYYESIAAGEGALTIGSTPLTRAAQREEHRLPTFPPLAQVLAAPLAEFQGLQASTAYNAAFWLVSTLESSPAYRARVSDLLRLLQGGATPAAAFAGAFGSVDLATLEQDYRGELTRAEPASYRRRWEVPGSSVSAIELLSPSEGHVLLALLYGSGRPRQARQVLDRALELDAASVDALARRAMLAAVTGGDGRADAERAVALDPSRSLAWEALAVASSVKPTTADRPRLVEAARKLERLATTAAEHCARALALDALGDRQGAATAARRAAGVPGFSPCRRR